MSLNKSGNKFICLLFLILFYTTSISGQTITNETENNIEEMVMSSDNENLTERNAEEFAILLEQMTKNPININKATREEMERIFILNDFQVQSILDYRKKYGDFLSIYELTYVFGFDRQEVEKILPYIYIEGVYYPKRYSTARHLMITKTEYRSNHEKTEGNPPVKLYNRYLMEYNQFRTGFTMENDAYEPFFSKNNKYGFDFYSAFAELTPNTKWINKIIIGDFSASFGQGLNLWGGYSIGKNINTTSIRKRRQGFKAYTSSGEHSYFRGVATSIKLREADLNIFVSGKYLDANILEDSTKQYFTSIQETGYHRTENEIGNENSLFEKTAGINLSKENNWLKTSITWHKTIFNSSFEGNQRMDTQFLPTGKAHDVISADLSLYLNQTGIFGEFSIARNKAKAWFLGTNHVMPFNTSLSLLYRNYEKGYLSFHGNAFGENSSNRNEKGFYVGIENRSVSNLRINVYADFFKFPWMTYYTDAPSSGNEKAIYAEYTLEKIICSFKHKFETKEKSILMEETDHTTSLVPYTKKSTRVQLRYLISDNIQFTDRIETNRYDINKNTEQGYLMYHDVKYILKNLPLTVYGRFTMFQSESFETRIYQYENDLRYSFYVPFLYGKGTKYYCMLKLDVKDFLDLYVKCEYLNYVDKEGVMVLKGQIVWRF